MWPGLLLRSPHRSIHQLRQRNSFITKCDLHSKCFLKVCPGRPHKVSTRSSSLAHAAAGSASLPLELHFQQVCNGVLSLKRLRSWVTGSSRNRRGAHSLKQRTPLPHAANFTYIRDTINNHRFWYTLLTNSTFTEVRLPSDLHWGGVCAENNQKYKTWTISNDAGDSVIKHWFCGVTATETKSAIF